MNLFRVRRELLMTVTVLELIDALSSSEKLVDDEVLESGGGGGRDVGRGTVFIVAGSGRGEMVFTQVEPRNLTKAYQRVYHHVQSRCSSITSLLAWVFDGILEMQGMWAVEQTSFQSETRGGVGGGGRRKQNLCRRGKARARRGRRYYITSTPAHAIQSTPTPKN